MSNWANCNPTIAESTTCIGGISPRDYTQWGYVASTPTSPDKVTMCDVNDGDPYMGIIVNTCEKGPSKGGGTPPSYNGVDYISFLQDCKGWTGYCFGDTYCNFNKCTATGHDYGQCGAIGDKVHYWWMRDWDSEISTTAKKMGCCVLPPTTPNRTKQCPTDMWYAAPQCTDIMQTYCTPDKWDSNCDSYMTSNLNEADGNPEYAGGLFNYQMSEWANGIKTRRPSYADPFLKTAIKWCTTGALKGTCDAYLEQACSGVTKDDLVKDTKGDLTKLCACYLSSDEYLLPGIIPVECDSTCQLMIGDGIPVYEYGGTGVGMTPKTCKQSTCVMDNVTVNYLNSKVAGSTTFNQICGCEGGPCTCIMNGVSINVINSTIGGGTTLSQNCSTCSSYSAGVGQSASCTAPSPGHSPDSEEGDKKWASMSAPQSQGIMQELENFWDDNKGLVIGVSATIVVIIIIMVIISVTP